MQEMRVRSLGREDPREKDVATSIIAWRTPWTEGPGRLLEVMRLQSQAQLSR